MRFKKRQISNYYKMQEMFISILTIWCKTSLCFWSKKAKTSSKWRGRRGSRLFSKGIKGPDLFESSHLFNGWHFICFSPYNNRISPAPQRPLALVLSQITGLTFPLPLCGGVEKKIPRLFTQSQEAMLRYVCRDKTSDGRQIRGGQRRSRTHTHREHTLSMWPWGEGRGALNWGCPD